jgi:hypothetical protein
MNPKYPWAFQGIDRLKNVCATGSIWANNGIVKENLKKERGYLPEIKRK